jgi:hypothetical protein
MLPPCHAPPAANASYIRQDDPPQILITHHPPPLEYDVHCIGIGLATSSSCSLLLTSSGSGSPQRLLLPPRFFWFAPTGLLVDLQKNGNLLYPKNCRAKKCQRSPMSCEFSGPRNTAFFAHFFSTPSLKSREATGAGSGEGSAHRSGTWHWQRRRQCPQARHVRGTDW